ncbi:MAG: response regulator [Candidatus Omnitrophica bacterium]|nr:response regulator [Candidatus Omnitrophota bacterium]
MPKKILIVEDNEKNRLLMSDILKYYGYEIMEAENGERGLKMSRENKPALVLLDLQMPILDGFDFVKECRNDPALKDLKIIAVTSFAMKGDNEKIMQLGADGYITKPIDTRQLPKLVEKYIGASGKEQQ